MKGIVLPDYNTNIIRAMLGMRVEESKTPEPAKNQVLIKIDAAPCNPSDIAFIRGMYNIKKDLPKILGFEGTGTVIKTGNSNKAKTLLGKRVSCFTQNNENGTWADFLITDAANCIVLDSKIDKYQAACFFVNPFTAYALFDICLKKHTKAIIQNAATGQIGRFIRIFAQQHNIKTINIVRKQQQAEHLRKTEEFVLNSSSENFSEELKNIAQKLNANIALDAVGGETTGTLLNNMPENSEIIVYGGLSGKHISNVEILDVIFKNKSIRGFNLNTWRTKISQQKFETISNTLQQMIIDETISTKIQKTFKLDDFLTGIKTYIGNMSAGKIVFTP